MEKFWKWFVKAKVVFGFMALDMCSDRMILDTIINHVISSQTQMISDFEKFFPQPLSLIVVAYQTYGCISIFRWLIRKLF